MLPISQIDTSQLRILFCDIDDTLTENGKLPAASYGALWKLSQQGLSIVPVTGRPAGWCEMIARFWPVSGVIGENGGFYFCYKNNKMNRHFALSEETRQSHQQKLKKIEQQILQQVPGSAIASDQFCRLMDLAIDFCEDVPALSNDKVLQIKQIFEAHGATAKISSIHVNGWFGDYDKLSMCKTFCEQEFGFILDDHQSECLFIGDSPNDEPMFEFFLNSVAVANVIDHIDQINHRPKYITQDRGANGFVELSELILKH